MNNQKKKIAELLEICGIEINGNNDFDIQVHDERLYSRVLSNGSLGLGEAYMDGWWDTENLSEFFLKILRAKLDEKVNPIALLPYFLSSKLFNYQTRRKSLEVGKEHYDVGNNLYQRMLDKRMVYTCGYWKDSENLDDAQEAKLDLICKKMNLRPGMKILDIGCGWGSFAKFSAEKYGVSVVGITISKEQIKLARKKCENLPIEIRFQDYRDIDEKFDAIVSIGMFEHVGPKNYKEYFKVARKNLKDGGIFLLHTIGSHDSRSNTDPWTNKYIFPNGVVPSLSQIAKASEKYFVVEDLHNFGSDYDKTLMAWFANFDNSWDEIKDEYDEPFYRMWKYYLNSSAGAFRARSLQLWQIVLTKDGLSGGYESVR